MRFPPAKRKLLRTAWAVVSTAWLCGCITVGTPRQPVPLQNPVIQTHEFDAEKTVTMNSVMSVLQDLGYILNTADKEVGLITASSPARRPGKFLSPSLIINGEPVVSTTQAHATAVIEETRPGVTSVRLNFVVSAHTEGQNVSTTRDDQVLDAETYRTVFDKIEEAISVRTSARAAAQPPQR
jgi:hypothetical protein